MPDDAYVDLRRYIAQAPIEVVRPLCEKLIAVAEQEIENANFELGVALGNETLRQWQGRKTAYTDIKETLTTYIRPETEEEQSEADSSPESG